MVSVIVRDVAENGWTAVELVSSAVSRKPRYERGIHLAQLRTVLERLNVTSEKVYQNPALAMCRKIINFSTNRHDHKVIFGGLGSLRTVGIHGVGNTCTPYDVL